LKPHTLDPCDLSSFKKFCLIDHQKSPNTTYKHCREISRFHAWIQDRPLTVDTLRDYLSTFDGKAPDTYKNCLSALKIYFRDYLDSGWLVKSFRFPQKPLRFPSIPTTHDVRSFYSAFDDIRDQAIFLLYATSGLRRNELLSLPTKDIHFHQRMIIPNKQSMTKKTWITFYNAESEDILLKYLDTRTDHNPKLFPMSKNTFKAHWKHAQKDTGLDLTPQRLRNWFCSELGRLGVPDRYVDAFCGRVPTSVLARHYTDYSPRRLKQVYDAASLTVFP
jgi:integrase/recombinase XerD